MTRHVLTLALATLIGCGGSSVTNPVVPSGARTATAIYHPRSCDLSGCYLLVDVASYNASTRVADSVSVAAIIRGTASHAEYTMQTQEATLASTTVTTGFTSSASLHPATVIVCPLHQTTGCATLDVP